MMAAPPSDGREWEVSPAEAALAPLPAWVPQLVRESNPSGRRYLPLPEHLRPSWRHDSYVAGARSMARNRFPLEAIAAALTVTDRLLGDPPKDDPHELEAIARWAIQAQAVADKEDDA
jgi:hypothetical protein